MRICIFIHIRFLFMRTICHICRRYQRPYHLAKDHIYIRWLICLTRMTNHHTAAGRAYLGLYFSLVHSFSVERFDDPQNSFRKSPTLKFRKCPLSWASAVGFSPSHFCCELMFIVNLSTVLEIFFLLWNQDRRIRSLLPWSRWSPFKVGIVVHVVCVSPKILDIAP